MEATFDIAHRCVIKVSFVKRLPRGALFAVERAISEKNIVDAFLTCKQMANMR